MKTFLFWPDHREEYIEVAEDLQRKGNDIIYWVCSSGYEQRLQGRFPKTVFHRERDALEGRPAKNFEEKNFPPANRNLIEKFHGTESVVLSMMNKHFDYMSIDERKQVYYNMLGYWYAVLLRFKPDALIFPAPPHSVYDYLTYTLAHALGIRTILFDCTIIGDRYIWMTDFRKGSEAICHALKCLERECITPQDLSEEMRGYYERSRSSSDPYIPPYVAEDKKKYSYMNVLLLRGRLVLRSIAERSFLKKTFLFVLKVFGENIHKEYRCVSRVPDLSEPFVYVPLNYQPECTTSPQGDIFVVQTLMLETLSAALPAGWRLYVKEHPGQWGPRGLNFSSSRYKGYYRRIAHIRGVTLVPVDTKSSVLIARSRAVATVSGTAGFEAILRQKPAIIFGHPWYQNAPALLRADSVESCRHCFEKIMNGFEICEVENCRFLRALETETIHAHFQEYTKRHSSVTSDESVRATVKVILEMLRT